MYTSYEISVTGQDIKVMKAAMHLIAVKNEIYSAIVEATLVVDEWITTIEYSAVAE